MGLFCILALITLVISVIVGILKVIGFLIMSFLVSLGFFIHWLFGKIRKLLFRPMCKTV